MGKQMKRKMTEAEYRELTNISDTIALLYLEAESDMCKRILRGLVIDFYEVLEKNKPLDIRKQAYLANVL